MTYMSFSKSKFAGIIHQNRMVGFTLVELAIVLVIVAVIIGVVLKAQELLFNAKVKRQVAQFKELMAAVYTYYDKYGYLPGDDPTASTRWPGAPDGDGDGMIEGWCTNGTQESCYAWRHLRYANLIPGDPTLTPTLNPSTLEFRNFPTNVYGGFNDIITHPRYGYKIAVLSTFIPGDAAEAIDRILDEGTCNGSVYAFDRTTGTFCTTTYDRTHRYNLGILF